MKSKLKYLFLAVIFSLFYISNCFASENLTIDWLKTFEFEKEESNIIQTIIETKDGGYLVSARSYTFSINNQPPDVINLIKYDKNGSIQWTKRVNEKEVLQIWQLIELDDLTFYAIGDTKGNALIIKYDENGNELWRKEQTDNAEISNRYRNAIKTYDGGLIILGDIDETNYLKKVDINGNTIWQKWCREDIDNLEYANQIYENNEGGFFLHAITYTYKENENEPVFSSVIIEFNKNGNMVDKKEFSENISDIYFFSSGDYITVGKTLDNQAVITKYSKSGNKIWENKRDNDYNFYSSIRKYDDKNFAVLGQVDYLYSSEYPKYGDISDGFIVLFDENGNIYTKKDLKGDKEDNLRDFVVTREGDIVIVGFTESDSIDSLNINVKDSSGIIIKLKIYKETIDFEKLPNDVTQKEKDYSLLALYVVLGIVAVVIGSGIIVIKKRK